ncbi:MAG: uracil phosphoribosyltransferase [Opitutales bacterium]|jgi:uracil phosphoribosyltransferase|nr:uracil phosphoribosyltransferase [Opitutales bacterium]
MPVHVIDHPLAKVLISQLRDLGTEGEAFRLAAHKITQLLLIEATRDLPLATGRVSTPLEETEAYTWAKEITIVPIIRAGISMAEPALDLFPSAVVGFVGLERDEATAVARSYYCKVPPLAGRKTMIVDPMLATGGSTLKAIESCKQNQADDISVVTIISSPEGAKAIQTKHPEINLYTATVDRELNDKKYILPGLGDFGDRLYNT